MTSRALTTAQAVIWVACGIMWAFSGSAWAALATGVAAGFQGALALEEWSRR